MYLIQSGSLTLDPRQVEVFCQEAGGGHARGLLHPARRPQLAHRGVDEREAGAAGPPRAQRRGGGGAGRPLNVAAVWRVAVGVEGE